MSNIEEVLVMACDELNLLREENEQLRAKLKQVEAERDKAVRGESRIKGGR